MSNAKGNLYGVDVKLMPVTDHNAGASVRPVGIELNGVDSGTDFFKYPEGMEYYRAFAHLISETVKGKPIFVSSWNREVPDPLGRTAIVGALRKDTENRKRYYQKLRQTVGDHYDFNYDWLDDQLAFEIERLEVSPDPEEVFYALGGQQTGVPIMLYDKMTFGKGWLEFRLLNGRSLRLRPDEVGLIRSESETLARVPEEFQSLFLNTPLIEGVLNSKALIWHTSQLRGHDFSKYLPPTMPYGLGLTDRNDLIAFIEELPGNLVVKKRGASSSGNGVEILVREEVLKQLRSQTITTAALKPRRDPPIIIREIINSLRINSLSSRADSVDDLVTVYQPFIPSIPIAHPETGMLHDGCARVMVYSPPNGQPVALGAQWRLAPKALHDESGTLEQRLRANLSRGATAVPMNQHHETLVKEFSQHFVEDFEAAINQLAENYGPIFKSVLRDLKMTDVDHIRIGMFFRDRALIDDSEFFSKIEHRELMIRALLTIKG